MIKLVNKDKSENLALHKLTYTNYFNFLVYFKINI